MTYPGGSHKPANSKFPLERKRTVQSNKKLSTSLLDNLVMMLDNISILVNSTSQAPIGRTMLSSLHRPGEAKISYTGTLKMNMEVGVILP